MCHYSSSEHDLPVRPPFRHTQMFRRAHNLWRVGERDNARKGGTTTGRACLTCAHNIQVLHSSMHQGSAHCTRSTNSLSISRKAICREKLLVHRKLSQHTVRKGYNASYIFALISLLVVNVDSLCHNKLATYLMLLLNRHQIISLNCILKMRDKVVQFIGGRGGIYQGRSKI